MSSASATPSLCYYQVWCSTDSKYEHVWLEEGTLPTTCPANTAHTIDSDSIVSTQTISQNKVEIVETGHAQTGGYVAGTSRVLNIAGTTGVQNFDYSRPIVVGIQSIAFTSTAEHTGDDMEIIIAPGTVVGILTSSVTGATNTFHVSSTVTANMKKGFFMTITDGAKSDNLGIVTSVNAATGIITTDLSSVEGNTYLASSPTYVQMNVKMLQAWTFGPPCDRRIGDDTFGASIIPANTIARVAYTNNSGIAKTFVINTVLVY
jgi:hypothetical protein